MSIPKIANVKPQGARVLVEMLSPQEALGTIFHVGEEVDYGAPQAYVLAIGDGVKHMEGFDIKVGDRVLLQGRFVPVPEFNNSERKRGIVETVEIKAVLEEEA